MSTTTPTRYQHEVCQKHEDMPTSRNVLSCYTQFVAHVVQLCQLLNKIKTALIYDITEPLTRIKGLTWKKQNLVFLLSVKTNLNL